MKITKLVLGIISIVLSFLVIFQSCAAGLSNTLEESGELGGSAGVILAICLLVAGILGIVTRNGGKAGAFISGGFYIFGGLLGFGFAGSYQDLYIWSVLSIAFGLVFIIGTIIANKRSQK